MRHRSGRLPGRNGWLGNINRDRRVEGRLRSRSTDFPEFAGRLSLCGRRFRRRRPSGLRSRAGRGGSRCRVFRLLRWRSPPPHLLGRPCLRWSGRAAADLDHRLGRWRPADFRLSVGSAPWTAAAVAQGDQAIVLSCNRFLAWAGRCVRAYRHRGCRIAATEADVRRDGFRAFRGRIVFFRHRSFVSEVVLRYKVQALAEGKKPLTLSMYRGITAPII